MKQVTTYIYNYITLYKYIYIYILYVSIDIHIYENPAHIPAIHGSSMTQERHLTVGKIHDVFGRWPTTSDCPWPSWKRDERRRCHGAIHGMGHELHGRTWLWKITIFFSDLGKSTINGHFYGAFSIAIVRSPFCFFVISIFP